MSQNPSSNEKDTNRICWQGDVDLEIMLRWHASAYFCTLLGCYGHVSQNNVDDGDSHVPNMELEGNGAQNIYDDAFDIAYL